MFTLYIYWNCFICHHLVLTCCLECIIITCWRTVNVQITDVCIIKLHNIYIQSHCYLITGWLPSPNIQKRQGSITEHTARHLAVYVRRHYLRERIHYICASQSFHKPNFSLIHNLFWIAGIVRLTAVLHGIIPSFPSLRYERLSHYYYYYYYYNNYSYSSYYYYYYSALHSNGYNI